MEKYNTHHHHTQHLISAGVANLLIALGLGVLARLRALVVLLLASLGE